MAEPPKILQVTYGAFSCTLEGFEDPVEALIAIVGHIRGLGTDDPLWAGAIRLPDAEELGRLIAEAQALGGDEVRIDLGTPPEAGPVAEAARAAGEASDGAAPDESGPGVVVEPAADAAAPVDEGDEGGADQAEVEMRMDMRLNAGNLDGPPVPENGPAEDRSEAAEARGQPEAPAAAAPAVPAAAREPEPSARPALGWFGDDEDDADEPALPSQLRAEVEERVGVDLEQLALALSVRRSPVPAEPEPPLAAPEAEISAEANLPEEPAPAPMAPLRAAEPAYDWGLGEDDDWFVSGAAIEPGPITMAPDPSSPGRRWLLGQSPDQDETVLLRILSRAESKLSDPEMLRRRETIAHLKAAVAATEAERAGSDLPSPAVAGEEAAAPEPAGAGEKAGSPPLRLVASQRVDLPRMRAALRGGRARPLARPAEDETETAPVPAVVTATPMPATALVAEAPETVPEAPLVLRGPQSPVEPSPPAAETVPALPGALVESAALAVPPSVPPEAAGEASRPEPVTELAAEPIAVPVAEKGKAEGAEPLPGPAVEAAVETPHVSAPTPARETFASFAAARGAVALPDLLEAATVWASRASGLGEATRVEVAALAAEVLSVEPPREEVLRELGILLREGRLLKIAGGRLRAAPGSRFDG